MTYGIIISFIIPVYNNEEYFSHAIDSILCQESCFKDMIEILIIDDGSTDKTSEIADSYSMRFSNVRVIHQENRWIYGAMNRGIEEARGEYIYILNSDDLLGRGAVQLLMDKIQQYNKPDVIWTKVLFCNVNKAQEVIYSYDYNEMVVCEMNLEGNEKVRDYWFFIQKSRLADNQANLYKRSIAQKHLFKTDIYGADKVFNLSIANDICHMVVLPEEVYCFCAYNTDQRNESIGRYYSYEHEMYNEIYWLSKELYLLWDKMDDTIRKYLVSERLRQLSCEIRALGFENCNLDLNGKVAEIINRYANRSLRMEASAVGLEREYESRILNGLKETMGDKQVIGQLSFVNDLIRFLPNDYRDNVDFEKLDKCSVVTAIEDKYNTDSIGKVYYFTTW